MFRDQGSDPCKVVDATAHYESGQEGSDVFGAQELAVSNNVPQQDTAEEDLVEVVVRFFHVFLHVRWAAHGFEEKLVTVFARFWRVVLERMLRIDGFERDRLIKDLVFDYNKSRVCQPNWKRKSKLECTHGCRT